MKKDLKYLILHNENDALEYLAELYGGIIRSIVFPILKDEGLVEDCINEIWFKVSKHLDKIGTFNSKDANLYICKIAKYTALDLLRKCKPETPMGDGVAIEQIANSGNRKLLGISTKVAISDEVIEMLDNLDPLDRQILILHKALKFTYKEIGEELGISEANASKKMQRIKAFIRSNISGKEV